MEKYLTSSAVISFFEENNISYKCFSHKPAVTSKESAIFRNSPEDAGAKALVIKAKSDQNYMLVLQGNKKIDNKAVKIALGIKKFSFISHEELMEKYGLKVGQVPPLGSLYGLKVCCDGALLRNEYLYFNICSNTESARILAQDYLDIECPIICDISDNSEKI